MEARNTNLVSLINDAEMICKEVHGRAVLSIRKKGHTATQSITAIGAFPAGIDFKDALNNAVKLGEEIARRWNECETKE